MREPVQSSVDLHHDPVPPQVLERVQQCAAGAVIAIALAAWVGWFLEIEYLMSVVPGSPPMNPNAALGCLMGGLAMLLYRRAPKAARAWAVAVAALGAVSVAEHVFQFDLRLDELLVANLDGSKKSSRITLVTACSLTIVGPATLLIFNGRPLTGQTLGILPGAFGLLVLAARTTAADFRLPSGPFMSVSYNTIVCLELLVVSLLFLEPHRGLMKLFNSDTLGATTARRLLPIAVVAPLILSRLSLVGQDYNLYDDRMGVALLTLGTIGVLSATIYATASRLHQVDLERRHALRAELAAARRLRHVNQELTQFTYSVSHEIKGPLTTILGLSRLFAEDLREGNVAEVEQSLHNIERCAAGLAVLIEDTLALTKSDQAGVAASLTEVGEIAREIREELGSLAREKGVEVIVDAPGIYEMELEPSRLRSALRNLVENSIQYSDPAKSARWVKIRVRDLARHGLRIEVEDNGLGIPSAHHKDVFRIYRRFHPAIGSGAGLGLALVKRHAVFLGGRVEFLGGPEGAVFAITLPRQTATGR